MKYILFGTGDYYQRFRHWFESREVVAVLDNDVTKQGSIIDGHQVIAPDQIKEYSYDAIVILSFYYKEMKEQLLALGVAEPKIYHFFDLHDLMIGERKEQAVKQKGTVLLLSHDLSLGGPALALYHAALVLRKAGYEVVFASMLDGELRSKLEADFIPVIIDERLQIGTMNELIWTKRYDLVICNTINYHVFLSDRDTSIPVIWWLHDSAFFYEGIRKENLESMDLTNLRLLSVGPVPEKAMKRFLPEAEFEHLIYGVSAAI